MFYFPLLVFVFFPPSFWAHSLWLLVWPQFFKETIYKVTCSCCCQIKSVLKLVLKHSSSWVYLYVIRQNNNTNSSQKYHIKSWVQRSNCSDGSLVTKQEIISISGSKYTKIKRFDNILLLYAWRLNGHNVQLSGAN